MMEKDGKLFPEKKILSWFHNTTELLETKLSCLFGYEKNND